MRRILLAFMSTLAAVVLLFGYRTSTPDVPFGVATSVAAGDGGSSGSANAGGAVPAAPGSSTSSGGGTAQTVTGEAVQTRYGPVQVQIVLGQSRISSVAVVQVPGRNGRDVEINNRAVPVLIQETLDAQSAQIDGVSGATYTSDGYRQSLQSAIDLAGL